VRGQLRKIVRPVSPEVQEHFSNCGRIQVADLNRFRTKLGSEALGKGIGCFKYPEQE
jgi:hypothetical protein